MTSPDRRVTAAPTMADFGTPATQQAMPQPDSATPGAAAKQRLIPLPRKYGRALLWRRQDIERWKHALFGEPAQEVADTQPLELVTTAMLAGELRLGIRTLRRRIAEAREAAVDEAAA